MLRKTAWLALLLLPGCAYQQAMQQGDAALATADFERARRAYAFAYDHRGEAAARQAMDRAQTRWVGERLGAAQAALDQGDHVQADRLLRDVETRAPDDERVSAARAEAQVSLLDDMAAAVASPGADARSTYELVLLARRLYPDATEPHYALVDLREQVLGQARDHLASGEYAEARATVAMVAELEPWQEPVTSSLDREIATTWADELVARAERARRGQPGLAAVLYARAHEVAERPADLEASRALWEAASERGQVAVHVDHGRPTGHAVRLKKATRAALEQTAGTAAGWSNRWDLLAKIYASEPRCSESRETEARTRDYIAGQREVPNPEFVEIQGLVEEARSVAAARQEALDAVTPAEQEASSEALRLEFELEAAKRVLEDAVSLVDQARVQQDRWRGDVETAQAALDGLSADATAARAEAEDRLAMTRDYAAQWAEKMQEAQADQAEAEAVVATAEAKLGEAAERADALAAEERMAEANLGEARKEIAALQARLTPLSPTMMEDVPETLAYDEVTWTNTCSARATVYLGTGWGADLDSPQRFTVSRSTSDVAHIGHEKAELDEDPKEYPATEQELTAALEAEAQQKVASLLQGLVDEYFETTLSEATSSMGVDEATDTLTAIYAGAPVRMDTASRELYAAHLQEAYGLEDLATLMPEPPPAPMETTAARDEAAGTAADAQQADAANEPADGRETAPAATDPPADTVEWGSLSSD